MPINTLLIDLDDTVYPSNSGLWDLIKERISLYMAERLHMDWEVIPRLRSTYYREYGTTLRGLMAEYHIDREDYLQYVHDVPLGEHIQPDPALRQVLQDLPQRKIIFTNADSDHAHRVTDILGITDCFESVVDIRAIFPLCKPMPEAFQFALEQTGEQVENCAFLDDSVTNLAAARALGFYTVRVGSREVSEHYHAGIDRLHDICEVLPCH